MTSTILLVLFSLIIAFSSCRSELLGSGPDPGIALSPEDDPPQIVMPRGPVRSMIENAIEQTRLTRNYTQDYIVIPYPNGDVPIETGACTDVIIRGFRDAGVDLQKEVHEDMAANWPAYPKKWGLTKTDTNIDHRRVPNLQTFFTRKGKALTISSKAAAYKPGDVVTWDLDGKGMTHIGIVSDMVDKASGRRLIIHNIGGGTRAEERLFEWKITGHYRYF